MKVLRNGIAVMCLLALISCANLPKTIETNISPEKIDGFDLSARISVKFKHDGFSGSTVWKHLRESDELWLYGPLGQLTAKLQQVPTEARLVTSDQKLITASTVEVLTHEVLGWSLPLSGLRYWILGQVSPVTIQATTKINAENRVVEIQQDGWTILISEYRRYDQGVLPAKIQMRYSDLEMRLVIDSWVITEFHP